MAAGIKTICTIRRTFQDNMKKNHSQRISFESYTLFSKYHSVFCPVSSIDLKFSLVNREKEIIQIVSWNVCKFSLIILL